MWLDFLIYHDAGIPYLRPAEESKINDKLIEKSEERQTTPNATPIISMNAGDQKFIDEIV